MIDTPSMKCEGQDEVPEPSEDQDGCQRAGLLPERMLDGKEEFDVNQHDARLKTTYPALRLVLLAATLFQTTGDVLFRSYSRRTLHETYTPASVLLVAEVMKLTFSFL